MANLKNKILQALKNGKNLETTLNDISISQENLLKNHSNPVFNNKDKNKILRKYTDLENLGQSLYRYNTLKENNCDSDARKEKKDIEHKVLNASSDNTRFIWISEHDERTCNDCAELDGQIFDVYEQVPKRLHPNCRCTVEIIEDTDSDTNTETTSKDEGQLEEKKPPSKLNKSQDWIMPCDGRITSEYGWRVHPVSKTKKFHKGWDIAVQIGTPIKAIADGAVLYAGNNDPLGYGQYVVINHGTINGTTVTSEYGHLSSWNVRSGQTVKQGQVIAKSGNTGSSTGPHLHITIKEKGQHVNPSEYIKH